MKRGSEDVKYICTSKTPITITDQTDRIGTLLAQGEENKKELELLKKEVSELRAEVAILQESNKTVLVEFEAIARISDTILANSQTIKEYSKTMEENSKAMLTLVASTLATRRLSGQEAQ
eukprot:TRINITY_DN2570_c0_g1_i1.p1 TRINITY_DN2570_c0_g1~~TRINITY_DN2570_c0_g1_i1.p1  ORF type:complete len:120 (-),score=7.45 TRINITY_DN2570_c0_g1_i1:64-423(-)